MPTQSRFSSSHRLPLSSLAGGGGGIGIHTCHTLDQVRTNFQSAAKQGQASFGDAGVFVEKYVQVGVEQHSLFFFYFTWQQTKAN